MVQRDECFVILLDGDSLEEVALLQAALPPLQVELPRCVWGAGEIERGQCRDEIEDPFFIPFCKCTGRMIVTDGEAFEQGRVISYPVLPHQPILAYPTLGRRGGAQFRSFRGNSQGRLRIGRRGRRIGWAAGAGAAEVTVEKSVESNGSVAGAVVP